MYPLKTKKPYDPNNLGSTGNIYTTVYLGNYIPGNFSEYVGSHPGVDIIPQTKNDNVVACLPGTIYFAGTNASNGNYVVIKHSQVPDPSNLNKKTNLYSCHLHLSELSVNTGDIVNEGDVLGKSGSTGNSSGEHLHFQIDREEAPFHPYWPYSFKEASDAGLSFFEATNKGLNLENGKKFTVNPLVYLDSLPYKGIEKSSEKIASLDIGLTDTTIEVPKEDKKPITSNVNKKYFTDVDISNEPINYLAKQGITKGFADGSFKPNNNISRAELLALTFNFAKKPLSNVSINFSDVAKSDWSYKYIATAKNAGIINGYDDGTFGPNNPITRAEAIAVILNTIIGKTNIPNASTSLFGDIPKGAWYEKYVYYTVSNGLLDISGSQFHPNDYIKRADVANILYNLRDKI
ncbi:S-layer homology domain-containing protein [Candidatus Gracilibacteria bacterium]|nr:S-layer homology domain-containing protein [Candidatus Gracilibacteria bacterium]